jgi:two-component system NtrC family response regulator
MAMAEGANLTPQSLANQAMVLPPAKSLKEAREAVERDMVQKALLKHAGNISHAAAELGISRPTLYQLMDKLGILRR